MLVQPHETPIPYNPNDEHPEPGEARLGQELIETMRGIQETTFKDHGHALRSVHAKSLGIFEGELKVFNDLTPDFAQGLFRPGANYPVIMRMSTIPGDILDDDVTTPRGLAVKILGVEGERLPGSEGDETQDFVLVNGPYFQAGSAKQFLASLKLLAATTDKVEGLKKVVSAMNRTLEAGLEAIGGKSANLKAMGGQPMTHPLGDSFFSQAALRYGDYVAKISVSPSSPELKALTEQKVDLKDRPDGMREEVANHIAQFGGEWDLRVQLRTRHEDMPIEDPSKEWSQDHSPYLPVGRITVKPQPGWSEARSHTVDDGLSFSPWHGIQAHQPLGVIMRLRKDAYAAAAQFRGEHNGCPMHEPRSWQGLPD